MGNKIYLTTFLLAIALAIALEAVSKSPGAHSTPGIWLMLAGLPGTLVGGWIYDALRGNDLVFFVATAIANWVFYICIAKGVIFLKGKFHADGPTPPS
ncbi:MAG: hypothetical protein WAN14_14625 [Candidatus Acidiferrales bacterium]